MTPRLHTLSARDHACFDLASRCSFAAAPLLFAESTPARATVASHVAGLLGCFVSICTRYPLGLFPLLSFRAHGRLELASVPVLIAAPWLLDFAGSAGARDYFVASGLGLLALWLATDYDDA